MKQRDGQNAINNARIFGIAKSMAPITAMNAILCLLLESVLTLTAKKPPQKHDPVMKIREVAGIVDLRHNSLCPLIP